MTGYGSDSAEILRRLPRKAKREAARSRPISVRTAIARKRAAQDAQDLRRFIVATAHLSDAEISGPFPRDHPLTIGMGSRRRWAMMVRWNSETRRRQLRTAHQVLAEARLLPR